MIVIKAKTNVLVGDEVYLPMKYNYHICTQYHYNDIMQPVVYNNTNKLHV